MNEKFYFLIKISLTFVPKGPIDNEPARIGSNNGLAPNRRQAIVWTNAEPNQWHIHAALGGDELTLRLYLDMQLSMQFSALDS